MKIYNIIRQLTDKWSVGLVMLFIVLLSATDVSAAKNPQKELRKSVAVVNVRLDSETKSHLSDYSIWLSRADMRTPSRMLSQLIRSGFGSGFVVEHEGALYLITNSHVVGLCNTANVTFYDTDTITIKNCECVYQNDDLEVAILALPQNIQGSVIPLQLHEDELPEGSEIFTAGFPALSNQPSWQYGQGIISNAHLLLPGAENEWIQHTGQIDKGSSGSPLLIRKDDHYEVVGINTLKARERDAVGMAVPAQIIRQALANIGYMEFRKIYAALDTMTIEQYGNIYTRIEEEALEQQEELFKKGKVLAGLAALPEYVAENGIGKKKLRAKVDMAQTSHSTTQSKHSSGKSNSSTPKKSTNNDEEEASTPGSKHDISHKSRNAYGIATDIDNNNFLGLNAVYMLTYPGTLQAGIDYHLSFSTYMRMSANIQLNAFYMQESSKKLAANISYAFGGQLPLQLGSVYTIPYLQPLVGVNITFGHSNPIIIDYGGRAGVELGIPFVDKMFVIGVEYNLLWYHTILSSALYGATPYPTNASHGIGVHIGFAF